MEDIQRELDSKEENISNLTSQLQNIELANSDGKNKDEETQNALAGLQKDLINMQ